MKDKTYAEVYSKDFLVDWTKLSSIRKPIIAAVSGYALGGGCELALMYILISNLRFRVFSTLSQVRHHSRIVDGKIWSA
jgi:1,4-dihydroxy-2-naphthoyl-CoA synthase